MELIRKTRKLGNSSGVLLPKSLLGSEVKIIVVKRPINIKKEILKLLEPFLRDLKGVYIIQENPVEVIAISSIIKKIVEDTSTKIKINIVPLSLIKKDIKSSPVLKAKLMQAKSIFNHSLLDELKQEIKI